MRAAQRFRMRPGKACFSLKTQALVLDSPAFRTNSRGRNFLAARHFGHLDAQSDRHGRQQRAAGYSFPACHCSYCGDLTKFAYLPFFSNSSRSSDLSNWSSNDLAVDTANE